MTARLARWLLALSVVAVALIVFQPQPTVASRVILDVHDLGQRLGLPESITTLRTEALLNTGMFVPAGLLAMVAFERLRVTEVVTLAFLASLTVETVQGVFLDARSMQAIDVVTNTFGGLLGALLGLGVRRLLARSARS